MGQRIHRCAAAGCRSMIPVGQSYCQKHTGLSRNRQTDYQYNQWRKSNRVAGTRNEFYHKRPWKLIRKQILSRDNGLCQYCNLFGHITPSDMVDHIVPREVSRAIELDESNLVSSCNACHNTKTKWEQKYYGTGQRNKLKKNTVMIHDYKNLRFVFEK